MSTLQFSFFQDNLKATSDYLIEKPKYPTNGKSLEQIEKNLKKAAIKSFTARYRKVQHACARPLGREDIEAEVLEAPILWDGIAAVFCAVPSSAASGTVTVTETVSFPVVDKMIVGVTFLVSLS